MGSMVWVVFVLEALVRAKVEVWKVGGGREDACSPFEWFGRHFG